MTRRRLWVAAAVVGLVLLTADLLFGGTARGLDRVVSVFVVGHVRDAWHGVLVPMTYPGQRGYVLVLLLAVTALAGWRTRSWRPAAVVVASLVATTLVVGAMKIGFGRTAPSSGQDIFGVDAMSYPSGHAVNVVVIWTLVLRMLLGLYGDRLRLIAPVAARRTLVAVVALVNAVGMVGLNYHWLSDMAAGWLLGVAIALLVPSPLPSAATGRPVPQARWPREPGHRVPSA